MAGHCTGTVQCVYTYADCLDFLSCLCRKHSAETEDKGVAKIGREEIRSSHIGENRK